MLTISKRTVNSKRPNSAKNDKLIDLLNDNVDHAELAGGAGNPSFVAQFDITVLLKFFTVAAGVYTQVTSAAVVAAQPTLSQKLPAFVFGNLDFGSGYATLRQRLPVNVWAYDAPFIFGVNGANGTTFGNLDAIIKAQLQQGDFVQPLWATLGAVNYVACVIVRCGSVGYGSLLSANNSDAFRINMVRYNVPSTSATDLAQYGNKLFTYRQSLFGKAENDSISPTSFKQPDQMQANIIDVPVKVVVDKEQSLSTYVNIDVASFEWNIFVNEVVKVN